MMQGVDNKYQNMEELNKEQRLIGLKFLFIGLLSSFSYEERMAEHLNGNLNFNN